MCNEKRRVKQDTPFVQVALDNVSWRYLRYDVSLH